MSPLLQMQGARRVVSAPPPSTAIALTLSSESGAAFQGQTIVRYADIERTNFTGEVTYATSSLPTGVTAAWSVASVSGTDVRSILTLTIASDAPATTDDITVSVSGTGVSDSATFSITIYASSALARAVAPEFTLPIGNVTPYTYDPVTDTVSGQLFQYATALPTFSGTTRTVGNPADSNAVNAAALQAAINASVPGDTIVVNLANYDQITLPDRTGSGYIHMKSASAASLPAYLSRVNPTSHAALMPKIVAQNSAGKAMDAVVGAGGWWFTGIEFTIKNDVFVNNLVFFGFDQTDDTTFDNWYYNIVFDRCIFRPPTGRETYIGNAIRYDVTDGAVVGCWFEGFWNGNTGTSESHILSILNSEGRVWVYNNFMENAGVTILIGGGTIGIEDVLPSDFVYERNYIRAPLTPTNGKNAVEEKIGNRVLRMHNVFENMFPGGQNGFIDVIKVSDQDGGCPWVFTRNITSRQNLYVNTFAGLWLAGNTWLHPTVDGTSRIDFHQNVFVGDNYGVANVNNTPFYLGGYGLRDVRLRQNTIVGEFSKFLAQAGSGETIRIEDNVAYFGDGDSSTISGNGITGDGTIEPAGTNQGEPRFHDHNPAADGNMLRNNVFYWTYAVHGAVLAALPNNTKLQSVAHSDIVDGWTTTFADRPAASYNVIHASATTKGAPWDRMETILDAVRS